MITKKDYKVTGILFILFFVLIIVGNTVLAISFNFPDILRESAADRFTLFRENQGTIVPAYYAMGLTSIIQIFMAVMMYQLTKTGKAIHLAALVAGITSGIFQILGFFRWVILIPMLSDAVASQEIALETIFFLEKFANSYMGMTVGEHLGTSFTGLWLILLGVSFLKNKTYDVKLVWLGLISGVALLIQSFEAVTGNGFLEYIALIVWGLYVVWVFIMSVMMFTRKNETDLQKVPLVLWIVGMIIYLVNVIPSLM